MYNQQLTQESTIFIQKIQIDRDIIIQAEQLTISIETGMVVHLIREYTTIHDVDNYVYIAYSGESANMYLSILNDNIKGYLYTHFGIYRIDTYGEDDYVLIKMDISALPTENEAIIDTITEEDEDDSYSEEDNLTVIASATTSTPIIRVLVLYTDAAERLLKTSDAVKNTIYTNINNANLSFVKSDINARLRLAYIGKTTYTETTFDDALEHFWKKTDDYMNEVHTLRERYNADVCVLLIGLTNYCGLSPVKPLAYKAFNVVGADDNCTSQFSFAHEIGHIMGCLHNREESDSDGNTPYKYGHGYVHYTGDSITSWRTMMAYSRLCTACPCTRILQWSNPNITYQGIPTGDATYKNNARVWNERAQTVSDFRFNYQDRVLTASYYSPSSIYESMRTSFSIITKDGYHIEAGQVVELESGMIQMLPGTEIKEGSHFFATTYIEDSDLPHFKATNRNHEKLTHTNNGELDIKITPNPAYNEMTIYLKIIKNYTYHSVILTDILGNHCKQIIIPQSLSVGEYHHTVDITDLHAGLYFVACYFDNQLKIQKLFIQ